ncbi:hypothetical protein ABGT15_12775 [Flavobacterium enshiense]|uniref:hypothetical protein n=1 Tax=Flavobacterium enshiense TaxID=1341165 RepID=UPI00345C74C5
MKHLEKLFIVFLLTSCSSTKMLDLGGKASVKGTEVSQKAIDIYGLLSQQADIDKSQQDKIKVLTNKKPSEMVLPDSKVADFSEQLKPRIDAYEKLLNTYKAFTLLTDSSYGDMTQEATSALQDSYNSIQTFSDIPESVSSKLPEIAKMISQEIQVKKIKEHNKILYSLTTVYTMLWDKDQKTWNDYIDLIYNNYAQGLNTVDSKKYDAKMISETMKEPYSDEATVILMYRLEKRDEIIKKRNDLKKQLNDFGKALKELNKAHLEISKSKTDPSDVTKMMNTIENLLKQ